MKTAVAFLFALVFGSITLLAQSSVKNGSHSAVVEMAQPSTDCPINMQAQWQSGVGTLVPTSDRDKGPVQKLAFTLTNPTFREIIELRITVHGTNSQARTYLPMNSSAHASGIRKSMDLKLKVEPKSEASTSLLLPGFTSVRLIELDSVSYAGASSWHSSAHHTCHVYPDATMLISKR